MRMLMTGVFIRETPDLIIEALKKKPMTTKELTEQLNAPCSWSLKQLAEVGAIKFSGQKERVWFVTGGSFRGICGSCSRNEFMWRIDASNLCHKCREGNDGPGLLKGGVYKDFDVAMPFNRVLRLPFGLDSKRYAECLNTR
ncbi:hypothetical protein [Vibrio sp. OPT18]|uniref:hypothetical protein n=1 Tax=Vibrio sp. OPT18 TaxID=2778641 RepID=UPI0018812EAB|nr:hypothetical protein [Vibrio sp. OPT18]MBE8578685.1 hypothetical protein [Vibrio sp. OPT18]